MDIANRAKIISPSLTLEITAKAKKMKSEGIKVVSFAAGEPDFNTPEYIVKAAIDALNAGKTKYTAASGIPELKDAVCEKLKNENGLIYTPSQIVISNGAKQSIFNTFMAILEEGDEVIIPAPYWLSYPEIVKMCGGVPVIVDTAPESGFKLTKAQLEKAITSKTKALIINDPSNPTGSVYTRKELNGLAEIVEDNNLYVVSDEIYEKLVYESAHYSMAAYSDTLYDRTILINGLSKSFSMTGWRIGYTASNKVLAKAMGNMQSHSTSNANTIAQWASVAALADPQGIEFLDNLRATFDARRCLMIMRLKRMNLEFIEPKGAFYVMVSVKDLFGKVYSGNKINTAHDIATLLLEYASVAVIPCESFGAPDYIRLSYAVSEKDIERGMDNIENFITIARV